MITFLIVMGCIFTAMLVVSVLFLIGAWIAFLNS